MMKKRTSTVLWLKGLRILKKSKFWREHITRYNLQSREPWNASKAQKEIDSLHTILHNNLKKFEQLTEDMDLLKSDVQMMDRLNNRRNRSNRVLSKRPSVKPAFKELKTQLEASLEKPSLRKIFESKDSGLCSGYTSQGSSFTSRATIN